MEFSEQVKQDQIVRVKQIWAQNIRDHNAKRHEIYLQNKQIELVGYSKQVPRLSPQDLFFLGMGLYWGEGSKKEKWSIRISNADPLVIRAFARFLKEHCNVEPESLSGWVHTYPGRSKIKAQEYWSLVSQIPLERIKVRVSISSASKGRKPKNTLPYGTFHMRLQNAEMTNCVHGWFKGILDQFNMPE